MEGSQTIAVVRSSTDLAELGQLEKILLGLEEPPEIVDDPVAQAREIIAQILASESEEEVEAFGDAIGWRELATRYVKHHGLDPQEGTPVEVRGFRWRVSEYEEGGPVYFIVRGVRMDDGSAVTLTTGSLNILAQLTAWAKLGALPKVVIATERDKATKMGYYPMWLQSVPAGELPDDAVDEEPVGA